MRRLLLLIGFLVALAACTPAENEGGTPLPGAQSGAPLYDDAVGPSDDEAEVDPGD